MPVLSDDGRNISFSGRAKSRHIFFDSSKIAQNLFVVISFFGLKSPGILSVGQILDIPILKRNSSKISPRPRPELILKVLCYLCVFNDSRKLM